MLYFLIFKIVPLFGPFQLQIQLCIIILLFRQLLQSLSSSIVLEFENVYLNNLPCAESYERSYMHRDHVTHVTATRYVIIFHVQLHIFILESDSVNLTSQIRVLYFLILAKFYPLLISLLRRSFELF